MAVTTPPTLLLSEEQRRLLDQFEFHAIQERRDTPVVWVGSATRNGASSTNSSISSSVSSSGALSSTSAPSSCVPFVHPSNVLSADGEQAESVTRFDVTATHDGDHAPPPAGARLDLLQRLRPEQNKLAKDSRAQELETQTPSSLHVITAAPLLHKNCPIQEGDLASPATSVPAISSHQSIRDLHTDAGGDSAVVVEERQHDGNTDILTGATQTSLDEQCQELAERLLRLSAEVDTAVFAMDHRVVSPSEFY